MNEEAKNPQHSAREVAFYLDGKKLAGIEGEPIAKALFAAGITTLSHSPKYHRPRGVHCARGRCSTCHMEVNGVPGVPTCITPLRKDMRIRREGFQPFYAPLLTQGLKTVALPAGFYYRMFTRPTFIKKLFMKQVRKLAGVGRITLDTHEPVYRPSVSVLSSLRDEYDTIVVGAGVAGMSAALAAGARGERVLLVDEYAHAGGHALGRQRSAELASRRDQLKDALSANGGITWCGNTTAHGFYPPDTLLLGDRAAMKKVRARSFIFATGAYDIIPLFENNDTPGIFGERAIRLLLERDDFLPGTRAAVYGSGARLDDVTALLEARGATIAGVVDPGRSDAGDSGARRMKHLTLAGARGGDWIQAARFSESGGQGVQVTLSCDLLVIAFAGQPAYELPYQAGFRFALSEDSLDENRVLLPASTSLTEAGITFRLAGEVTGEHDWRKKIDQGTRAGERARVDHNSSGEVTA